MADKMTIMKKWLDDIIDDPYIETTEQELAYIIYAAVQWGLYDKKVDLGEVFGKEFGGLNRTMPNIYGQIDNIQNYSLGNTQIKYDNDAIKELRLKGMKAKEICAELGYPLDKAKSLTSNKGWIEAGKILKENSKNFVQICTESTDSVQVDSIQKINKNTDFVQKNTDLYTDVQKCTDSVQTESTEKYRSVQKNTDSVQKNVVKGFNF